jgi:hypothetical protein
MPDLKKKFFSILKQILINTDLSESFLDRISSHFENLNLAETNEAINIFQESIQNGLVQILNISRPSFVSSIKKPNEIAVPENQLLNGLAQSYKETLSSKKKDLFEKWILYLQETGSRSIGKQRLDVFLLIFEKRTENELVQEIDFRINIGHSGLFLTTQTKTEEKESQSSNSRKDYFKKMAKENERLGKELAKDNPAKKDEKYNERLF